MSAFKASSSFGSSRFAFSVHLENAEGSVSLGCLRSECRAFGCGARLG
jgi:hypothetical protein